MRLSIRSQLLLPLVAMLAGVVALSAWTALASAARVRRQIAAQLDNVAHTVQSVTFPLNPQTLGLMRGLSGAHLLVCDAHRQPLLSDQGKPLTTLPTLPVELPEAPTAAAELPLGPRIQVGDETYFCRGVALQPSLGGNRVIYIFYPESLWREALAEAVRPALIVGALVGAAALLLTVLATQRITRRVRELGRRTRLIADGDFSPMPLPRGRDELHDLGAAVNEMAGRLARFEESLRSTERLRLLGQVSGGLAHQLRNGVAGAKLAVQLHVREQQASEALDVTLRQLAIVELQLKRFLDLGKATELRLERRDLGALLDEAAALVRPRCLHAGIELRRRPPEGSVAVRADAEHLSHVLLNLLTNAVEAAGPGGWVELAVHEQDGKAIIEVRDSGAGVDAKIAERLFEPFVTGKPEGIGLGLAVARQIVSAHGGSIAWSRGGDATCFRIEMPPAA